MATIPPPIRPLRNNYPPLPPCPHHCANLGRRRRPKFREMTIRPIPILFSIIHLLLFLPSVIAAVDPWTGIFREFALGTKEAIKKFFDQIGTGLARSSPIGFPPPMAPPCPLCRHYPIQILAGHWHLSLISRSFRLNTLSELDTLIDRTQAGLPFNQRRTFQDLVADPPEPICPTLTVLEDNANWKWELAYRLADGRPKSIIGPWAQVPFDGTFLLRVGSLNFAQFCIALASSQSSGGTNTSSPSPPPPSSPSPSSPSTVVSFVLLNQVDGWPRCENFVALTRNMNGIGMEEVRDLLEQQGIEEGTMNRLERTKCGTIE